MKELHGLPDSRGPVGQFARGKPVYLGGSNAAHRGGGPQYGRPRKGSAKELEYAIARRLGIPYGNK